MGKTMSIGALVDFTIGAAESINIDDEDEEEDEEDEEEEDDDMGDFFVPEKMPSLVAVWMMSSLPISLYNAAN